jgi:hypothetical protein
MNEHEAGFLMFLEQPQRRRLQTLFERGDKRRRDIRALLPHRITLDRRYCENLAGADQTLSRVLSILEQKGAGPSCFLVAQSSVLDGREMPLADALDAILGMGNGAYISCIPGRLGFYQYAHANGGYLLHR